MPTERDNAFMAWLQSELNLDKKTARDYVQRLISLGFNQNVTLDKEYNKDKLANLIGICTYTQADYANGKPDPIGLPYYQTSIVKHHKSWLDALVQYKVFCEDHPPK